MKYLPYLLALAISIILPTTVVAGWQPTLSDHSGIPKYFWAVDKNKQSFFVLGKQSPLTILRSHNCTTGQVPGDKNLEGDLKTPEGVYFVQTIRKGALNWDLYGDLAFTLDYPNPVDRLKGKTGYGIWVHGRGNPIVPRETQGCVALNNPDIHELEPETTAGLPVLIAQKVTFDPSDPELAATAGLLEQYVQQWAKAWSMTSPEYFTFYNPEAYSKAHRTNFSYFRKRKERIFSKQPWIEVLVTDIQSLPGPDYWVTWFNQFYRTPSLVSSVVKRLYWQKDDTGQWHIVGEGYGKPRHDLKASYLEVREKELRQLVNTWRKAWERADIPAYTSFYHFDARQDERKGIKAIVEHKKQLWSRSRPSRVDISDFDIRLHKRGLEVLFRQDYSSDSGYSDSGYKSLVFEPQNSGWAIVSERWFRHRP